MNQFRKSPTKVIDCGGNILSPGKLFIQVVDIIMLIRFLHSVLNLCLTFKGICHCYFIQRGLVVGIIFRIKTTLKYILSENI